MTKVKNLCDSCTKRIETCGANPTFAQVKMVRNRPADKVSECASLVTNGHASARPTKKTGKSRHKSSNTVTKSRLSPKNGECDGQNQ